MDEIDVAIVKAVGLCFRRTRCGVYPKHVAAWLDGDLWRSESTIRRRFVRLSYQGKLLRVGHARGRRGYLLAN